MKTLSELAREAYEVQNACNLSGVVHSFARAIADLREHVGYDASTHPIAMLWADKIASLTGTQTIGDDRIMGAYAEVQRLMKAAA